ncbi:MAG: hypothetical protein Q9184_007499, partial [Pyrenodesmia sp. 2 TL-2023]
GRSDEYTPPPKRKRLSKTTFRANKATAGMADPSSFYINPDDVQAKFETEMHLPILKKPARASRACKEADDKIIVAVDLYDLDTQAIQFAVLTTLQWNHILRPLLGIDKSAWSLFMADRGSRIRELQLVDNHYKWGFQIPSNAKRLQWFKLGLDASAQPASSAIAEEFPDQRATTPTDNQSPEVLATEYLRALHEHVLAVLEADLPQSVYSTTSIEYVLTVPAIWSEMAKDKTRQCAQEAGMGEEEKLRVVSEPEAAAVWSLNRIGPFRPKVGDIVVVCDAGGGTVDLISYEITALKPILRVIEAVSGHGCKCGSTFLNRRFEAFLRGRLSGHESWDEDMMEEVFHSLHPDQASWTANEVALQAMEKFESKVRTRSNPKRTWRNPLIQIKREYNGSLTQEYHIPVPGFPNSPAHDVQRARFYLKGSDLIDIFEPLILQVVALVRQQVDATKARAARVRAVLMVGGFGENTYLRKRIEEAIADDGIEMWRPSYAWTAVVRGALMKALADIYPKNKQVSIDGRRARAFYGTESAKEFRDAIHPKEQRIWNKANNRYENMVVKEKKPIDLWYHSEHPVSAQRLGTVKVTIVKWTDGENIVPPVFADAGGVSVVTRLQVPLDRLAKRNFKIRTGEDGRKWYIVDYKLQVTYYSSETVYELRDDIRGYGRVEAEYV